MKLRTALVAGVLTLVASAGASFAQAPEHYENDPANLNPDPGYTPGAYPLPEVYQAKTAYYAKKAALADLRNADGRYLFTLGLGEIAFTTIKNKSADVLGYFREYLGVVEIGERGPVRLRMVIDVNSMDTAVPGRNNRILDIFFQSMKPELGTVELDFDSLQWNGTPFTELPEGGKATLSADGTLTLNGITRPVSSRVEVERSRGMWSVRTMEPVRILISDFAFEERVYALMKECNHKSVGNAVTVETELFFR